MKLVNKIKRYKRFFKHNTTPFNFYLLQRHTRKRILSKFFGVHGMRMLDIALSYDCNLKCEHCSAESLKSNKKLLTIDDYKSIAAQAIENDFLSINITGGEPLVFSDLHSVISAFDKNKLYISLQSNAVLLNEHKAQELRAAGVNALVTSLDDCHPAEHDNFRGVHGSFARTIEGIKAAQKAGLSVLVGGTVTHQNIRSKDLEDLIRLSNDLGAIFLFNLAVPCGKWIGETSFLLTEDDRQHLDMLLEKYPFTSTDMEGARNVVGCPAGSEKIYITPYGDVIPCPFIHVSFGNVRDEKLSDIIKRMHTFDDYREYQKTCIAAESREFQDRVFGKLPGKQLPAIYSAVYPAHNEKIATEKTKCIICDSQTYEECAHGKDYIYWTAEQSFSMVQCSDCGHIYLNERPLQTEVDKIYPQNYYTKTDAMTQPGAIASIAKQYVVLKRLAFFDFTESSKTVVEVGCGDCSLLIALKKKYPKTNCIGVDFSFTPAQKSTCAKLGIRLIEGPAEHLALSDNSVDLVIMNQLIEHLWDPHLLLAVIAKALKPGGVVSIETVNINGYDRKYFQKGAWGGYYFPRHLNLFSPTSLAKLLQAHGLTVLKHKNLTAPIIWIYSLRGKWYPSRKPTRSLLEKMLNMTNPFALGVFAALDFITMMLGRETSNQKIIAMKQYQNEQ